MIPAIVIEGSPPICFEISRPIGAVTDLGIRDLLMTSSSPKRFERTKMLEITVTQPAIIPVKIGGELAFSKPIFL